MSILDSSGFLQKVLPVDFLVPRLSEGGSYFLAVAAAVSACGLSVFFTI